MLEAIKNGTLLFEIEFISYPTPNHILLAPIPSPCAFLRKQDAGAMGGMPTFDYK
jgi:hypothetical protein